MGFLGTPRASVVSSHSRGAAQGPGDRARRSPVESSNFYSTGLGCTNTRPRGLIWKQIRPQAATLWRDDLRVVLLTAPGSHL
jgi:hypothetical protein